MKARILFYLAVVAALVLVSLPQAGVVGAKWAAVYVPDDYPTIQQAVDNATEGATIVVRDGTYHENVDVDKASLTIQSENGTANCVVNAASPDAPVFNVTADGVSITGFTVQNATGSESAGIYLALVEHCNVSGNNAGNNTCGIWLDGSSNNTLTDNNAVNNTCGIYLESSSDNNTLTDNTATNGNVGIWLNDSSGNTLTDNNAGNNTYGVILHLASGNTLTGNVISGNDFRGVYLEDSSNNTIYNNYFSNINNVQDDGSNVWNTTRTEGTNIIGGSWLGGNYWSDYEGVDIDGDGLGNTQVPYAEGIPNCGDYLPLVTGSVHNLNTGEDFYSIQAAIDDADTQDGHTIAVGVGTYHENVVVNKQLTIESTSEDPADTVVNAASPDAPVFSVTADGVSITGFTVQNATEFTEAGNKVAGVYLNASANCTVSGNEVTNNYGGIWLDGSSNNTLTGNNAEDNACGIYLESSSDNNTLTANTATSGNVGIWLNDSSSNTLSGNNAGNSTYGIILYLASGNTLTGNSASSNNHFGLYIEDSSSNTFTSNNVSDNSRYGIFLEDSSNNTIYNNCFNNTNNVRDDGSNIWNTTKTEGTNIIGGSWLGGNYWSDYAGEDTDGDGLGNTLVPYAEGIPHCGDYLPLASSQEPVIGGVSAPMSSMGAMIEGTTYEANANLLADASVTLELDGREVARTASDADGHYHFTVGEVGSYTVNVTKGGFTSQDKWANVTALERTCTADFKGMDAPYPTAPSGSYVIKCSNLWLSGHSYPPGFALNGQRVSDVTYAWAHPS